MRNKHPFFFHYYLNRVTVLPRLSNQTIPLTIETRRPRDSEDNLNYSDITTATTGRSRTTDNIDKTGSHWDMVDKLLLVMTNPMIKPMSSIISDAIMANSSLDLKLLMLSLPQRLSNQPILYNKTATATATPFSNIINYSSMMTDGTDSPRAGAENNIRSGLRRTGAIHRPKRTLQRSEEEEENYITRRVEFF
ncbi:hypothetical protein BY996DRAFT_6610857 [Phakopsora pachyrhizi]|nr:hypothetical protein BY996DRAFT_6610857 [Phakopsora pachyrhizi]